MSIVHGSAQLHVVATCRAIADLLAATPRRCISHATFYVKQTAEMTRGSFFENGAGPSMDRERQNSSQSRKERELRQETRVRSMLSA